MEWDCLTIGVYSNRREAAERATNATKLLLKSEKSNMPPKEAVLSAIGRIVGYEIGFRIVTRYRDITRDHTTYACIVSAVGVVTPINPPQIPSKGGAFFTAVVGGFNSAWKCEFHHFPLTDEKFERYPETTPDPDFPEVLAAHRASSHAIHQILRHSFDDSNDVYPSPRYAVYYQVDFSSPSAVALAKRLVQNATDDILEKMRTRENVQTCIDGSPQSVPILSRPNFRRLLNGKITAIRFIGTELSLDPNLREELACMGIGII